MDGPSSFKSCPLHRKILCARLTTISRCLGAQRRRRLAALLVFPVVVSIGIRSYRIDQLQDEKKKCFVLFFKTIVFNALIPKILLSRLSDEQKYIFSHLKSADFETVCDWSISPWRNILAIPWCNHRDIYLEMTRLCWSTCCRGISVGLFNQGFLNICEVRAKKGSSLHYWRQWTEVKL